MGLVDYGNQGKERGEQKQCILHLGHEIRQERVLPETWLSKLATDTQAHRMGLQRSGRILQPLASLSAKSSDN